MDNEAGGIDSPASFCLHISVRQAIEGTPVGLHGDVSASKLLVGEGRLAAVVDFGCSAVGDPACDLTIAWTFLSGQSPGVFRRGLPEPSRGGPALSGVTGRSGQRRPSATPIIRSHSVYETAMLETTSEGQLNSDAQGAWL